MAKTSALVLTLFGFALRLIQLDAPSVGPAEAVNGLLARRPIAEAILLLAQNARPPLYNIGLHLWAVTGQTDFALRLLSALAGALTVSVVFALARELFGGNRIPFVAALLIALAPYQIANAQSAQATAWFGLTCAAASW
ncbi:MAG: glycosyltransferase family 39 protein, partial [Chloroflexi bacterium]|nr:glycosyltransferase family 39 protein [Chloroflexota bacterium]